MNNTTEDFEQISFNPFKQNDTALFGDESDPDLNYFNDIYFQN